MAKREVRRSAGWLSPDFAPRLAGAAILGAVAGGYGHAWWLQVRPGGHPWSGIALGMAGVLLVSASRPGLRALAGIAAIGVTGMWLWNVI